MMAAYAAAESGHAVTLLEQNENSEKAVYYGKGRCNLTNASDMEQLFANVVSNRKFLYSAFTPMTMSR